MNYSLRTRVLLAMGDSGCTPHQLARAASLTWPENATILGASKKTRMGEEQGVLTAVVYLAPSTMSKPYGGDDLCLDATPGCIKACLGHSAGRLAMDSSRNAQLWKTLWRKYLPAEYEECLANELEAHAAKAHKLGMVPAARLDGSSDTGDGAHYAHLFPDVEFYDYTKDASVMEWYRRGLYPANYTLTFSLAETRESMESACMVARNGGNVAVVFATSDPEEFPKSFLELPVLNGDVDDVRFRDPRGHVVALTAKGAAKNDRTGFVQEV